jgi:hypothetical protein
MIVSNNPTFTVYDLIGGRLSLGRYCQVNG